MNITGPGIQTDIRGKRRWIVTGGAGFIGSHSVEKLLSQGDQVLVIDDFSTGRKENLPAHPSLEVWPRNLLQVTRADLPEPIDGILHLAALPSVTESWADPLRAHERNLTATLHLLELARQAHIPRLVFASSAAVYGHQDQLPISEDLPLAPQSPYGAQKAMSEQYLALYAREMGLTAFAMRFFNVFGPRQRADSPYSGVISIFAERMRQGLPITVFGDGQQTRDFIYVGDVVNALAAALTTKATTGQFLALNVGTGARQSIGQLIDTLRPLFPQWAGQVRHEPGRPGEILHSQADCRKIKAALDFKSTWTFPSGLKSLVQSLGN